MRRILRKIAANEHNQLGDTTTLADPSVVESLVNNRKNGDTALWLAMVQTWTNAMPDDSGCNCPTCTQGCN